MLDDGDLLGAVVFLQRTFPNDFHTEFLARLFRTGFDRFPKAVRGAFRNDGDSLNRKRERCQGQREEGKEEFFHEGKGGWVSWKVRAIR